MLTKYTIVIPAHNEEDFIAVTLNAIVNQTVLPYEVIVVNDHSTDKTQQIVKEFSAKYSFIKLRNILSKSEHQPGSKVVQAFLKGYEIIDPN
ncbi:MAG: glycosyltransferase, partial [Algoriella sp.]